jgi:internalin A
MSTVHLDRILGPDEPTEVEAIQTRKALFWAFRSKDAAEVRSRALVAQSLDLSRDPWSSAGPAMDVSLLSDLPELRAFEARYQKFSDTAPLVEWLTRGAAQHLDLTAVGPLPESLVASFSQSTALSVLRLGSCSFGAADWVEVKLPPNLVELSLTGVGLKSSLIFAHLSQLESLNVAENDLTELRGLANARSLKKLVVAKNMIADLAPLSQVRSLQDLDVSDNAIDSLDPLRDLRQLRRLNFARNRVRDIRCLKDLDQLEAISLAMNPLHESDIDDVIRRSVRVD